MPYARLDDGIYDHPKLDALGRYRLAGVGLWVLAIAWSNRYGTDGVLTPYRVVALGGTTSLADRLVTAGMLEKSGRNYLVHDFLDFSPSREEKSRQRSEWAERKRRSRSMSPGDSQRDNGELSSEDTEDMSLTRARARGRPTSTSTTTTKKNEKVDTPLKRARDDNGATTLSKKQLDSWADFGREWDAFKTAWIGRGLLYAPLGRPDDEDSQRSILYQVLDARPTDLVRWVKAAPKSARSASDVVAYVLEQWHGVRAEVGLVEDEPVRQNGPTKGEAAEALGEIMKRL